MENFTHIAKFHGIPCYFNEDTFEVKGKNLFYDLLIDSYLGLDELFSINKGAFEIQIISKL